MPTCSPTESTPSPSPFRSQRIGRKRAVFQLTVLENPFIPPDIKTGVFPKQAEFLSYEGEESLYGGAAGGGKSAALLIAALQYVTVPGYAALILRRTYKQLAKADSILGKAKEWLLPLGVKYNGDEKKFTFPSGATLEFGHMDHEDSKHDYQGGVWQFIGVDETTQFTGTMIAYPRTRQRRGAGSRIPIRWRGASNPGGVGHEYVKEWFIKAKNGTDPSTPNRQFFPATIDDNPHIDKAAYIRQLKESGVDGLLLAQLLRGDWDAVAGGRFKADWFGEVRRVPSDVDMLRLIRDGEEVERFHWRGRPIFQTCDPAASTSAAADYFVLSTWCLSPRANLCWLGCRRGKWEIQEQLSHCQRDYRLWKPQFIAVEEVLNQRALAQLLRRSTDPPMVVHGVTPGGKKKLEHALGAIVLASTHRIYWPTDDPTFPLDDVRSEVTRFTGDDDLDDHDDVVDSLSIAVDQLALLAPTAAAPSFYTGGSPFAPEPDKKPVPPAAAKWQTERPVRVPRVVKLG